MTNINYRDHHAKVGQELPGTDFVLERTSERYHTWYDEVNNKVVLSIKGTSFTKDTLQTWGGIAKNGRNNKWNPYVRGAQAELDRIKKEYPNAVIEVAGHSLGGNVAQVRDDALRRPGQDCCRGTSRGGQEAKGIYRINSSRLQEGPSKGEDDA